MREKIFRAKILESNKWIEGYYAKLKHYVTGNDIHIIIPLNTDLFPRSEISCYVNIKPETLGQWTGLVDKNGTKIFEGDIMHNDGNVVEFYNGSFCINGDSPLALWTNTEVIGNIYD